MKPLARKILIFSAIAFVLICLSLAVSAPAFFAEGAAKEVLKVLLKSITVNNIMQI